MVEYKHNFRERQRDRDLDMKLIASSVHLPYAFVKEIAELNYPQSKFIRDAVAEKLDRETGYEAAVERTKQEIIETEGKLKTLKEQLIFFENRRREWLTARAEARVSELAIATYLTASPSSEADLLRIVSDRISAEGFEIDTDTINKIVNRTWKRMIHDD